MATGKLVTLLVAVGLLLAGCSYTGVGLPERNVAPSIPAYPKAQNVIARQDVDATGTITFDTTDPPSTVLGYYDKMIARQWNSWQPTYEKRPPTGATPRQYIAQGCPFTFFLTVEAVTTGQSTTHVTLIIRKSPWCY